MNTTSATVFVITSAALLYIFIQLVMIVAILRIFTISITLTNILKKLGDVEKKLATMDQNRREEFNALTESQQQ